MLPLPDRSYLRGGASTPEPQVFCDWIEASALLLQDPVSQIDVVDRLTEELIYDEPHAQAWVLETWRDLRARARLCSMSYPFTLEGDWIRPRVECWTMSTAYSFCLLLSLAPRFSWWSPTFGRAYAQQGTLFERLCEHVLLELYRSWMPDRVGSGTSSYGDEQLSKQELIDKVCEYVGCRPADLSFLGNLSAKSGDIGLDLIWCRPFPDLREGTPYFLIQCASGDNWGSKLGEPNLQRWRRILNPATAPQRGFMVPFWFSDETFINAAVDINGLLIDRCRLMSEPCPLPDDLAQDLQDWCRPRVETLISRAEID